MPGWHWFTTWHGLAAGRRFTTRRRLSSRHGLSVRRRRNLTGFSRLRGCQLRLFHGVVQSQFFGEFRSFNDGLIGNSFLLSNLGSQLTNSCQSFSLFHNSIEQFIGIGLMRIIGVELISHFCQFPSRFFTLFRELS